MSSDNNPGGKQEDPPYLPEIIKNNFDTRKEIL